MTEINRRAGERIARSVRKSEQADDFLEDEVQASSTPFIVVVAQEDIAADETGLVKRAVRAALTDAKGNEEVFGESFYAYSRFATLEEGDFGLARWIDGGWELFGLTATTIEDISSGTGGCCDGKIFDRASGSIAVGSALAFPKIVVRVIGSGSSGITLDYSGGTWSSDSFNVDCGGSTVTMHYEFTAIDTRVADEAGTTGVQLVRVDGSANNYGTWRNTTQCWRPNVPTRLLIVEPGDLCGITEAPCEICITPGNQTCAAFSTISGYSGFPGVDGGLTGYGAIRCSGSEALANPSRACDGPPFVLAESCTFLSSIDGAVLPGEDYQLFVYLDAGPTTFEVAYAVATTSTPTAYSGTSGSLPIAQIFDPVPIVGDPGSPSWTAQAF